MGKLHIIDVSIVLAYLVLCLVIGLYKSTKIKNIREYAVGNRSFSTFVIISTIFATYMSANQIIGKTEQIYNLGLVFGGALFFTVFNWWIVKVVYAKNIGKFDGCISMSEIMGRLYGDIGHYLTSIALIVKSIGFTAVQVTAMGYLFHFFFGFTYIQGVFIGITILTIYSALGGVRAVALTDVFQFLIFFLALPLACGYAYTQAGGYNGIIASLPETHLKIFVNTNTTLEFFGYIFWIILPAVSAPYVQRLLMARNRKQLTQSYNILIIASLFFACIIFTLGFSIRVLYPNIEAKMALYHFVGHLPSIFIGLMVAGMLAVIMSTSDSWLNALSVIVSHDVIKKIFPQINEKNELLIARIATFFCAIVAVIIAIRSGEVFKLVILFEAFSYAIVLVPFTIGFFKFKTNLTLFSISASTGAIFTFITKLCVGKFGVVSLMFGTIGSAIGFFTAHYVQVKMGIIKKEEKDDLLSIIMKQAKPTFRERIKSFMRFCFSTTRQMQNGTSYCYTLALFLMVLNIPILIFGYYPAPDAFNIIAQHGRYLILLLALTLILHELIGIKNVNVLLYIVILLTLPVFNIYLFMMSGNVGWGINCLLSILAIFLFIPWVFAVLLGIIGAGITAILFNTAYWIDRHMPIDDYINVTPLIAYSIITLICMMSYMIINKIREARKHHENLEAMGHSIVHDLNAPFVVSGGLIDLTKKALKKKKYDQISEYLEIMESSNKMASRDMGTLLQAMSHNPNAKPEDWGEYSAMECIKDTFQYLPMRKEEKERLFLVDVKDMSGKKEDFVFIGSEGLFRHVLFNLIQNAFVHAGSRAKIEIFIYNNKIYVKDNGFGIPDDIYDKLFEKYTTTIGHGLGLHFCKQAMLKMNGDIECMTEKDKGTQFVLSFDVCLPYKDVHVRND